MRTLLITILIAGQVSAENIREWVRLGNECLDAGDGAMAAQYYKNCIDVVGTGRSIIPLNQALYNIARIYHHSGNLDEAEKYIMRTIGLGKILDRPGSLALRYVEASEIALEKGDTEKALDLALKGLEYAMSNKNENTRGRVLIQIGECKSALGLKDEADSIYREAVIWLGKQGKGRLFVPEAYRKLGRNAEASKDTATARLYYEKMLEETKWGFDQLQMYQACCELSSLFESSDPGKAAAYAGMADSLSFAKDVANLGDRLALSNLEFARKERDAQIALQKQKTWTVAATGLLAILASLLFCLMMIQQRRARMETERRNADLIKMSIQKDRLIAIAKAAISSNEEIAAIEKDAVQMPTIKLTSREIEIARMACQGKLGKEIASELGISPRTVGVHKNNLFRKLGVGNTIELIQYMRKLDLF